LSHPPNQLNKPNNLNQLNKPCVAFFAITGYGNALIELNWKASLRMFGHMSLYIAAVLAANYTATWFIPLPIFGMLSVGTLIFGITFTQRDRVHRYGRKAVKLVSPVGDAGWSHAHEQARQVIEAMDGVTTSYVEAVAEGPDSERVIQTMARKKFDLIFATSFGYMDSMLKVARQFPRRCSCTAPASRPRPTWATTSAASTSRATSPAWSPVR
jgi:hypothetical protein